MATEGQFKIKNKIGKRENVPQKQTFIPLKLVARVFDFFPPFISHCSLTRMRAVKFTEVDSRVAESFRIPKRIHSREFFTLQMRI